MDKLSKEKNTEHSSNAHFTKNERIYYRAPLYHSRSACDRTAVGRKVSRIQLASEVQESPFAVYSTVEPLEISAPAHDPLHGCGAADLKSTTPRVFRSKPNSSGNSFTHGVIADAAWLNTISC